MEELSNITRKLFIDESNVVFDIVPINDLELFFIQSSEKCTVRINLKPLSNAKFKVKIYIFAEDNSEVDCVCRLDIDKEVAGVETDIQIRSWPFDRSKIQARPEMFIANSNVVATHGNALGIIKPAEQYYLATRGVQDYKQLIKQSLIENANIN